ncbi:MAG: hypothetical protein KGN02_08980 [bacterium]|nr:hypothetical protein [bacterium]
MRRWILTLGTLGALLAPYATRSDASPDPYSIYAQARSAWRENRYPPQIAYDVAVAVTEGGKERVERYRSAYDARRGVVRVDPVSDYELAHPVKPTGVNLALLFLRVGKPLPPVDFLGVPRLAPTYSFGMSGFVPAPSPTPFDSAALVREIRADFHDPNPRERATPTPRASELPEIAFESASHHDYTVTLLGSDEVAGHACYHLRLRPMRDPRHLRLRELWVDQASFATWKIVEALNFANGPGTTVPWTIRFADLGGAHYIAREDADAPIRAGGEIYERAEVRFEHVREVVRMPLRAPLGQSGTFLDEP